MSYELELCEAVVAVPREVWAELSGSARYPFLRREWLSAFEETGCVGQGRGWIPRHVVVRRQSSSGSGEIVAVAPAYLKLHSMGEFVFDHGWAEFAESRLGIRYYPKLVVGVPFTPATGPRVLLRKGVTARERDEVFDVLTGGLPEVAHRLGLSSVHVLFPDERDAVDFESRDWALRLGVQFQFHNRGHQTFEDYLNGFRSKRRAVIRRECRSLDESDVAVEVLAGSRLGPEDARLAHALYLTTVDKHVWGRRYLNVHFFERVIETMPDAVHFVVARRGEPGNADSRVIAGAFNLLGERALYGRYWGAFEDVPFLHFNVCLYRGVAETIRLGLDRFEPGAGGEHKESRGFAPTLTRSMHYLADPRLDAAVRDFLKREGEALRAHVEGPASAP